MILLDYSNVSVAAIMALCHGGSGVALEEKIVRHAIINAIRARYVEFKGDYGEMIIVCDSHDVPCWRYDVFPYYKAARKQKRKADKIDWEMIFTVMDEVKQDLIDHFPFKVVTIDRCEADDIIGWTALNATEPTIIVGSDKDYYQCHSEMVSQYIASRKEIVCTNTPHQDLMRLVMAGDVGDGIPNIRSDDDTFIVEEKRQRPMSKKKINEWLDEIPDEEEVKGKNGVIIPIKRNFDRNRRLIDFTYIPDDLKKEIDNVVNSESFKGRGNRNSVFKYLANNRMRVLLSHFNDFF